MKHIVGLSGGIDSQAAALWVRNRYPAEDVIALNTDAGEWEHPLTVKSVDDYSAHVFPVTRVIPLMKDIWADGSGKPEEYGVNPDAPLTFVGLAIWKHRFPSRRAQFCTEILKLRPQRRWVRDNVTDDYVRYIGNRRDESKAREGTPFSRWDEFFDCEVRAPLADWTKQMCFDYVKAHGEPINPLYAQGAKKVGCKQCVNGSKDDILNTAIRFPFVIDEIRQAESEVGATFFPPFTIPGRQIAFVDEVVEWSKTKRGGRQQLFPILHEREACESKYGLCE